jgi:anaerobic ribonucleoside-triphosphate reductase activating protein
MRTCVEGPGQRAAIWVQGCSIRCPGCFNPHTWSADAGELMDTDTLSKLVTADRAIEGVTFLGGEPFDQAAGLALVGRQVRECGLSVMTFTGHRYEQLLADDCPGWRDLLSVTDLLVDGPYLRAMPDLRRPWVGSTNQRFIALTDRYLSLRWVDSPHISLEIRLRPDGTVAVNGMADRANLKSLRKIISEQRAEQDERAVPGHPGA